MSTSIVRQAMTAGVGRRIFVLFLIAAIVPMTISTGLAFFEFHRSLEIEASQSLRASAKDYGLQILGRLQVADRRSSELLEMIEASNELALSDHQYLLSDFDVIQEIGQGKPKTLYGDPLQPLIIDSGSLLQIPRGEARLVMSAEKKFAIARSAQGPAGQNYQVVFQLTDDGIWGTRETLSYNTELCVFSRVGERLYCTTDIAPTIHAVLVSPSEKSSNGVFGDWRLNGEEHYAAMWQLFLQGTFDAPPLDIVAVQPKVIALQAGANFRHILVPAVLLVFVLVGVLSLIVINRSLGPLTSLTNATSQIASGEYGSRVYVRTGDEFERLGDAFNNMAAQIGSQISTLEAMSGIDRLILTGTKLDEVSANLVARLVQLTGCQCAAVIARDSDDDDVGTMISMHNNAIRHERVDFPAAPDCQWTEPRQVSLHDEDRTGTTYASRFLKYGRNHVVFLPVVLNDEIKGLLLLGFDTPYDMKSSSLQSCVDLASRFAVALSSVEREEALYQQAHFDTLTGLPNRQLLKDRLTQQVAAARLDDRVGAILFLDLDRFKEINDVFGHSVGDEVLKQAAARIKSIAREHDTVARIGGDEFVIVLPSVPGDSTILKMARSLLEKLSDAFTVSGTDHYLSASIGIAMYPDDGVTVETLLKNADAAMYRAKDAGRGRFEFFSKSLNAESRRKIGIERDLRTALHNQDLEVYYQPQVDILTGEICGAESLLRWTHPRQGPISPAEFIPLAEDSDLIVDIGTWVIEKVCGDLASFLRRGLHPGAVSINVSGRQLADTRFSKTVMQPIRRHNIHPGYIQMEVTETVVAQNRDRAITILQSLREEGVRVAIDDFGTGYSSLSYLQQMPFDVIKIDKSFIDQIGSSEASDNICCTIIKMAEQLGKKSTAEGVETKSQLDFLRRNGCNVVQGYYYFRPLPKRDFLSFMEKQDFHTQRRKALEIL
ncbi:MAG TPA: EAL domain-containing protein [Woeseiaceae bacterium]|nr:EAL domain-containing protein [Woeseiaceae bacterium]